jgi:hypothetical protein
VLVLMPLYWTNTAICPSARPGNGNERKHICFGLVKVMADDLM